MFKMIAFLKMRCCVVLCLFAGFCVAQDNKGNPHFQVDHKSGKLDIMATRSSADIQSTEDYVDLVMKPGEDLAADKASSEGPSQRHDTPDQSRGGNSPKKSGWRDKMRNKGSESGDLNSADTRDTESDKNIVNFNQKWDNLFKFPKVNSTVDTNVRTNVTTKNETTKDWKGADADKMVELEKGAYDLAKMIQDGSGKNDPAKIKDAAKQLEEKVANLQKNVLQNLATAKDKTLSKLKSESKTEKAGKLDGKGKDKKLCSNCGTKVPKPGEKDEDGKLIVPKLSGANDSVTTTGFKDQKDASSSDEVNKQNVKVKEDGKARLNGEKVCPTCGAKVPKPGDKDENGNLIVPKISETDDTSSKNGFKEDENAKAGGETVKAKEDKEVKAKEGKVCSNCGAKVPKPGDKDEDGNLIVPKLSGANETSENAGFNDNESAKVGEDTVKAKENKDLKGGKVCPTCGTKVPKPGDKDGNLIVPKLSGTEEKPTESGFKEDENAKVTGQTVKANEDKDSKATTVCPNCGAKVPKPGDKDEDGNLSVPKLSGTNETSSNSGIKEDKSSKVDAEVEQEKASYDGTNELKVQELKNTQGKHDEKESTAEAQKLTPGNQTNEILDQSALKENKTVMVIDKGTPDRSESFDLDDDSQEITEEAEDTDVLKVNKDNDPKNETLNESDENKQEFSLVASSDTKIVNETKPEASENFNDAESKEQNLQRKKPKEVKNEEDKVDRNQDENEGKGTTIAAKEGERFGASESKESALAKGEGEKSDKEEGQETEMSSSEKGKKIASALGHEGRDKSNNENKASKGQRLDSTKWAQNGNVAENSDQGEKENEEKTSNNIIDPNKVGEKTEPEDVKEKDKGQKGEGGDGKEKGKTFAEREESRNSYSDGKVLEDKGESKHSDSETKFSGNTEENKNSDTQEKFTENSQAMEPNEVHERQQESASLGKNSQASDSSRLSADETVKTVKQFDAILNNFLKNTTKEKGKELLKLTWHDLRQKYTKDFGGNKNMNNPGQKEDLNVLKDANKNGLKNEALGTTEKEKSDSVNEKQSKKGDDLKAIVNRLKYKISLLKDLAYRKHKTALEKPLKEKAKERDFDPYQGFKRG